MFSDGDYPGDVPARASEAVEDDARTRCLAALSGLESAMRDLAPALNAAVASLREVVREVEVEREREAHPRIRDGLGRVHRRYRAPRT